MANQFPANINQGILGFYTFGYDVTGREIELPRELPLAVCIWNNCMAVVPSRTSSLLAHVNAQHPNVFDDGRRFPAVNQMAQSPAPVMPYSGGEENEQRAGSKSELSNELLSEIAGFVSSHSCVRLQSAAGLLYGLLHQRAELYLDHFSPKNALKNVVALQQQNTALQQQVANVQQQNAALQQQVANVQQQNAALRTQCNNLDNVARQMWNQLYPAQPFPY